MSNKLTVSVKRCAETPGYCAHLQCGGQGFGILPDYLDTDEEPQESAQHMANMLRAAIATHDAALLAQCDRLRDVCRWAATILRRRGRGAEAEGIEAAIAETETTDE